MMNLIRRIGRDNRLLRNLIIPILALRHSEASEGEWLICPMYHDIRQGEEQQFALQLRYMKSLGDFIELDTAVSLLKEGRLGGRYFCLTFDDGYWGAYANAFPVLRAADVPAIFFVVPNWIDQERVHQAHAERKFVTWEACRDLSSQGMLVGSHTSNHVRPAAQSDEQVLEDLIASRTRIATELGRSCEHFACPWGQPNADYLPNRDPALAQTAGYKSFLTTISQRGDATTSAYQVPRIRVEPSWSNSHLRYMFFR